MSQNKLKERFTDHGYAGDSFPKSARAKPITIVGEEKAIDGEGHGLSELSLFLDILIGFL